MNVHFARGWSDVWRGARLVLVIAPQKRLRPKTLPRELDQTTTELLLALARETKPGDLGAVRSTLTGKKPPRLALAVLPDTVSRHNAPARAESIRKVVADAGIAGKGKVGILLLLDQPDHLLAAVSAIARALPTFSAQKKASDPGHVTVLALDARNQPVPVTDVIAHIPGAVQATAALVDTPPSDLNTAVFAQRANDALAAIPGVVCTTLVGDELLAEKLGGIHAVGRAALTPPRLVLARYHRPAQPQDGAGAPPHVALVGKGITYDTGGLSLKSAEQMTTMKCDMAGAAAVLGAFVVLTRTGYPGPLSLLLCLAENAIGPAAYKPDDILTLHSGKTVEINNTDAEGRLLLADGVSYAARVLGATVIFDAATLTGAQCVATGLLHAAVISNDAALEQQVVETGRATGDLAHPLPFAPEFFQSEFKSPVADMRNSVKNRANANASCAAQFVYAHLQDVAQVRWCHIDLAGPAFPSDRATGYGVALLTETVRQLAQRRL